jgi:hypothetical protein
LQNEKTTVKVNLTLSNCHTSSNKYAKYGKNMLAILHNLSPTVAKVCGQMATNDIFLATNVDNGDKWRQISVYRLETRS